MTRTCSYLRDHRRALVAGLVLAAMAAVPMPMWGQWNGTNPVWTNSNVGIGTTSPFARLTVARPASAGMSTADGANTAGITVAGSDALVRLQLAAGAAAYNYAGIIQASFDNGGGFNGTEPLSLQPLGGNVGIGTTSPQYKLAVNGNIGAQDIIVTNTGWSDYVFRPGYRLRPLSEVSQYIQANGHLPDIPTEAEVKEKGVSLGDMQAKLLAKVEELTLHMIQQDKENREARENLTRENQELRDRLARLEKGAAADSTPAVAK
jgi:hypothetical protein